MPPFYHNPFALCRHYLEQKGIISDRCELNRQIKADNTLLRKLKLLVRKLMDAVKNTVPAIAEAMETVRQKMIVFRYQLLHFETGKEKLADTLQIVKPDLRRYENIVRQLKGKIRERRTLLDEKKATQAIQVFRHRELARKIAGLTEDIEELKSEKALLLNQFSCADNHGMDEIKQHTTSMESSLKKLDQQEKRYNGELETALAQYTKLRQEAKTMNTIEIDTAPQALRPAKECEAAQRLQATYDKKFNPGMLSEGRKEIATLLDETVEPISIRQQLYQISKSQDKQHSVKWRNMDH